MGCDIEHTEAVLACHKCGMTSLLGTMSCDHGAAERLQRLEEVVKSLCEQAINHGLDNAWQKWADPLHEFIKVIENGPTTQEQL